MKLKTAVAAVTLATFFGAAQSTAVHAQAEQNAKPPVTVEVVKGDTLSKIASAHQTTYTRLFDANTQIQHPDVIHPGEKIRIPDPSEQLPSRPLPAAPSASPAAQPAQVKKQARSSAPRSVASSTHVSDGSVWDRLARCESGGNYSINTGNGYYGGFQFSASTWRSVGGSGLPHQASKEEQIARAKQLQARSGWGQWPACSKKLGLR